MNIIRRIVGYSTKILKKSDRILVPDRSVRIGRILGGVRRARINPTTARGSIFDKPSLTLSYPTFRPFNRCVESQ
jgi:hypothetical protein